MQVFRIASSAAVFAGERVLCLGFFDGMHRGHAAIFAAAREEARRRGCRTAVFSFADGGGLKAEAPRLFSEEERLAHMEEAGAEEVFLFDFAALRDLSPDAFIESVLLQGLSPAAVFCGENFRFGARGAGDTALLRAALSAHGIPLFALPLTAVGGRPVSASAIRAALSSGRAEEAAAMLGRPYTLAGEVIHGKALGRRIGIPTANIPLPAGRVLPAFGVYAVLGRVGDAVLPGIANIGLRPTVETADIPNCEVHFFEDPGDLYGRHLQVSLLSHLRGERTFPNLEALLAQIARDRAEAKEYIETWQNGQN